jgi:hypothetical protein
VAVGLDDGAQDIAADAAKAVDGNADGHFFRSPVFRRCRAQGAAPSM